VISQRAAPARTQPWAATAGAKINYSLGAACRHGAENTPLDGSIDIGPVGDGLEIVRGPVPNGLRAPGLIQKLK
jgi:hypothetical protein